MSIVIGILNIAQERARAAGAEVIRSIEIEVGQFAGVEVSALEFSFEIAREQAGLAEAQLIIHEVPGECKCTGCDLTALTATLFGACPDCGQPMLQVIQGRELRVRSITVD